MLINEAYAQAATSTQAEPSLMSLLPLIGILVIFYFLLIRPQTKRAKEQKLMREGLQKGDEVIISGGELGRVTSVGESYITLEIAPNIEITVLKAGVQTLLPKGTLKNIDTGKGNKMPKNNKPQKASDTQESDSEDSNATSSNESQK
ncbi:protein translocase subunit yajC [Nitrosomonas nitrosa]|jgi:preprotein translocase subunit YajC|uniref:Sec translocon accessory complex subunit YajC n=1 Tax=Nitrosomonas nitrosa TaxID=52442 RepID=A0A8H8YZN2_9PROT|nr:preprotein translocase subunit YajC [Nitrosomonas nitrosa]MCO6433053.1 preprotein translocase subunit YajC [Nitrosomonas nitrosa]PTQ93124.1 protein translocase subunit yajC [Nitrosomonas nitrosa]CAE6499574.1 Preprotein translocase subunit YajC [Nitrosomonas nitrosa]